MEQPFFCEVSEGETGKAYSPVRPREVLIAAGWVRRLGGSLSPCIFFNEGDGDYIWQDMGLLVIL